MVKLNLEWSDVLVGDVLITTLCGSNMRPLKTIYYEIVSICEKSSTVRQMKIVDKKLTKTQCKTKSFLNVTTNGLMTVYRKQPRI